MLNNPSHPKNFKKISLILSALFLIFSCFVFFFLYKKINGNRKTEELAETKWRTETIRRENIKSLERSITSISKEKNLLELHFIQSSDVVPFLDIIEHLAIESKVKSEIVSVDFSKDSLGLLVELKTAGNFESIYKFLTLLENSPYELEFISVNMQNSSIQTVFGFGKKVTVPRWEAILKIKLLSFIQ